MKEFLSNILANWPMIVGVLALIWLATKCFINVRNDEVATLERRWLGKEMSDGRTVALSGEVGIQARILGPGLHFLIPFIFVAKRHKFLVVGTNEIGIVEAITGNPIPPNEFFAQSVDCNFYQDGEAFLKNGGFKGPQLLTIAPGEHRINPLLFKVRVESAIDIGEGEVGIVEAVAGGPIPAGRIFADPVPCEDFQNAQKFIENGGQKGPQVALLTPGMYRINTDFFQVEIKDATEIPGGKVGLITAMDGAQIPDGRILADKIDGHSNFEKGDLFIKNGGQKGRQIQYLMPGTYRINTRLFELTDVVDWIQVGTEEVGVVTVLDGKPIVGSDKIAADEIKLDVHSNYQDADAYIKADGQKGLQIPVLRPGNYAINPWFARVTLQEMVRVQIGECLVVTSFVGEEGDDTSDSGVNAKIVENGKKGIWKDPLGPGKHALNLMICKVNIVPTTQILLSWADDESSAHSFDSNLKTITLRTADAFNVNMDVRVIIHIAMGDAPKVVANLGSVENMISQVLEPAISSHFRNAAQAVEALDLYTKRGELQEKAKLHIQNVLKVHHIESKDTMIADVVLPERLTQPVTDRQIAEQEKKTFEVQKNAQTHRKALENETAQANMQSKVVESERNVDIQKNIADGKIKEAEGSKQSAILTAQGKAEATKLNADADAEQITKVGNAEAAIILAKGKAKATSYDLEVKAMGEGNFGRIKVVEQIAAHGIKLIPENIVVGGGEGGNLIENFLGISMIEKLTGKPFSNPSSENTAKGLTEEETTKETVKKEVKPEVKPVAEPTEEEPKPNDKGGDGNPNKHEKRTDDKK